MCIIYPPILQYREMLARLTPFWTARREVDKIIERDRRQARKYKHDSQSSSGSDETDRHIGLSVELSNGFYYMWFGRSTGFSPGVTTCLPLMIALPDYIVQKRKLRRDQIEYIELKLRRIHS
jgi:hypothetical protein